MIYQPIFDSCRIAARVCLGIAFCCTELLAAALMVALVIL